MYLAPIRRKGLGALQPLIDEIVTRNHPRTVFIVDGERIKTCPAGGTNEQKYLGNEDAALVGTYDAQVEAQSLYEDLMVTACHPIASIKNWRVKEAG